MLKVEVKNHSKFKGVSFSKLMNDFMDSVLDSAKEDLIEKTKHSKCENCKEKTKGTIIISNNKDNIEFSFTDFCCEDFKRKFTK